MGGLLRGSSLEISSFILDIVNWREEPSTQMGTNLMEVGKIRSGSSLKMGVWSSLIKALIKSLNGQALCRGGERRAATGREKYDGSPQEGS